LNKDQAQAFWFALRSVIFQANTDLYFLLFVVVSARIASAPLIVLWENGVPNAVGKRSGCADDYGPFLARQRKDRSGDYRFAWLAAVIRAFRM